MRFVRYTFGFTTQDGMRNKDKRKKPISSSQIREYNIEEHAGTEMLNINMFGNGQRKFQFAKNLNLTQTVQKRRCDVPLCIIAHYM